MALLEIDGVIDAYFEDEIEILVASKNSERRERIDAVLSEHEIEIDA